MHKQNAMPCWFKKRIFSVTTFLHKSQNSAIQLLLYYVRTRKFLDIDFDLEVVELLKILWAKLMVGGGGVLSKM
jgi:hypothetical protein